MFQFFKKEEKTEIHRLDAWTQKLASSIVPALLVAPEEKDEYLAQPSSDKKSRKMNTSMKLGKNIFHNLDLDVSCGRFGGSAWLKLKILQFGLAYPVKDVPIDFTDAEVKRCLVETMLEKVFPKVETLPILTWILNDTCFLSCVVLFWYCLVFLV